MSGQSLSVCRFQTGYSLLELLTTLLLIAIATALAFNGFAATTHQYRTESVMNQLFTELRFARSSAISYNAIVTVCGTDDGMTCRKSWTKTLLIFDDKNRDKKWQTTETLYRRSDYYRPRPIIFKVSTGADHIRFKYNGMAMEFGSINDCLSSRQTPEQLKTLVLSRTGRSRIIKGDYHSGKDIGCPP